MSIVLATSRSREEGLELDGGQEISELLVSSPGVSAITEDEVTTGALSGDEGAAKTIGRVNWVEAKVR